MLDNGDICVQCFTEGLNFDKGSFIEFMEIEGTVTLNKDN